VTGRRRGPNLLYAPFKLLFDHVFAALALVLLLPLMLMIGLLIYLDDPGPVIFRQVRAGRWHQPFVIYKFRTMKRATPNVSTEELRRLNINPYTRTGPLLRRTSLDELPQLLNVLKGEMSLVGPRPALMTQDVVLRGREQRAVHALRPGVTGLAQITGRDDLPDDEKIERDAVYLKHVGPLTDSLIILYTVRSIFNPRGVY
jgi:O-antigen biosynthesis protein WbqP